MLTPFLSDYVRTLNLAGKARASAILEQTRIDKVDATRLVEKLSNRQMFSNLALNKMASGSIISSNAMREAFRDASARMNDVFLESNDTALVLSSAFQILSSEIKALEDELTAMEKSIFNYAFLMADNGAYDYSYLEPFNDAQNQETSFGFLIPDRSLQPFGPSEQAVVRPDEGVLAITPASQHSHPIQARVLYNNAATRVTSDTGIENATNNRLDTGWRVAVASRTRIDAPLSTFVSEYEGVTDYPGVNVLVECLLDAPAPTDYIRILPLADIPIKLVQARIYTNAETTTYTKALNAPITISSGYTIQFPLQAVAKVELLIQQPIYKSISRIPNLVEQNHMQMSFNALGSSAWGSSIPLDVPAVISLRYSSVLSPTYFADNIHTHEELEKARKTLMGQIFMDTSTVLQRRPQYPYQDRMGNYGKYYEYNFAALLRMMSSYGAQAPDLSNHPMTTSALNFILANAGFMQYFTQLFGNALVPDYSTLHQPNLYPVTAYQYVQYSPGTLPNMPSATFRSMPQSARRDPFSYEYNLGIKSINMGTSDPTFKGVWVSKPYAMPGEAGEVRLRSEQTNFQVAGEQLDQPIATSVEYSVTNRSIPDMEKDWVAILPVGTTDIIAERFFINANGQGKFRFSASKSKSIKLYKNGLIVDDFPMTSLLIDTPDHRAFAGMKLPKDFVSSTDVLLVDYTPYGDPTVVNFEQSGFSFETPALVAAHGEDGAGELFTTTALKEVQLAHKPFIDYSKVATATYDDAAGLVGYTPISVVFEDGTVALNLTNYKGGTQTMLDPSAAYYQFIHTDINLLFNKPTEQSFRVYYNFMSDNLRVRSILRCNYRTFVSPQVDYVQIKTKTRKADALRI